MTIIACNMFIVELWFIRSWFMFTGIFWWHFNGSIYFIMIVLVMLQLTLRSKQHKVVWEIRYEEIEYSVFCPLKLFLAEIGMALKSVLLLWQGSLQFLWDSFENSWLARLGPVHAKSFIFPHWEILPKHELTHNQSLNSTQLLSLSFIHWQPSKKCFESILQDTWIYLKRTYLTTKVQIVIQFKPRL